MKIDMNMKTKTISLVVLAILMVIGIGGCSKDKDYNPDDYIYYSLNGDYGKDESRELNVTINEQPLQDYGYVKFEMKNSGRVADICFVNVIPGESERVFEKVPITSTDLGNPVFTIEYTQESTPMVIRGEIDGYTMTVNINM